jgi:hypothetical protein
MCSSERGTPQSNGATIMKVLCSGPSVNNINILDPHCWNEAAQLTVARFKATIVESQLPESVDRKNSAKDGSRTV